MIEKGSGIVKRGKRIGVDQRGLWKEKKRRLITKKKKEGTRV
jgi:hypothetical protein